MIFRNPLALALSGLLAPASVAYAGLGLPTVDLLTSVHVASLNVSECSSYLPATRPIRSNACRISVYTDAERRP